MNVDGQVICPDETAQGIRYYYDEATQTFYAVASFDETQSRDGVQVQLRYVVNCPGNTTDNPVGVGECTTSPCVLGTGEPGVNFLVYQRIGTGPWELRPGVQCRVIADPIPLAEVEAEIRAIIEERFKHVAEPEISVAPAVNALVNLPVIAATPDPGPLGFDITNPLPGRVDATPSYFWTWSNGTTGSGPGVAYDGTSPTRSPGHYPVQSTFADGGDASVELVVSWSITLTVPGIPPITDIEPLEYSATEGFTVRSARTILVE